MRRRRFLALGAGIAAVSAGGTLLSGCSAPAALPRLSLLVPRSGEPQWAAVAHALAHALPAAGLARRVEVVLPAGRPEEVARRVLTAAPGRPGELRWLIIGLRVLAGLEAEGEGALLATAAPLARLVGEREVLVVPASSRLRDFAAFADALRRTPDGLRVAGGPAGGAEHLLFGMIAQGIGVDARRIYYAAHASAREAAAAVLDGRAAAAIGPLRQWRRRLAARDARALAVSSADPVAGLEAPSLRECGVRVDYSDWCGLIGPAGAVGGELAAEVCDRLGGAPAWERACRAAGWNMIHLAGDEFRRWLTAESARVRTVLRDLGLLKHPNTICWGSCESGP